MKSMARKSGEKKRRTAGKRILTGIFGCVLTTILFTGCGSADSGATKMTTDSMDIMNSNLDYNAGAGVYEEAAAPEYEMDYGADGSTKSSNGGILDDRKLIQNVRLEVETKEFEQLMTSLETQVEDMGGYVESMETYNGSSYSDYSGSRYAQITFRVPRGQLNAFLQTVSDISNVVRRYENVEDVTLSYVDMESRKNTLRTEQSRLLEFLDRAETVEEIITLEERLSEVRYQLESMESQLRTIDNLVDYSTVEINVSEVRELTPVELEEPSVWERIGKGFMGSLRDIGGDAQETLVWFVTHIPYLVIWALVILVLVICGKKMRAKQLRKKEAREQEERARMQAREAKLQEWEAGQDAGVKK